VPDSSSPCLPSYFLKIPFNIIHPSTPMSYKWSISLMFHHQNSVCTSPLSHTSHVPRPPPPWFDQRIILGDSRSWSSSLCIRLHSLSVVGTNIFLSSLSSSTLSLFWKYSFHVLWFILIFETNTMHKLQTLLRVWSAKTPKCFRKSVLSSCSSYTRFKTYYSTAHNTRSTQWIQQSAAKF